MAPSNKITLTVAGDASGVQKALGETEAAAAHAGTAVSRSSQQMGESLVHAGSSARSTREIFRGLGDATAAMGGEIGSTVQTLQLATAATKDLARGSGELIGKLGLLRVGLIGLAVAGAAAAAAATSNQTGWANLGQDVFKPLAAQLSVVDGWVQKLPNSLGFLGSALDGVTNSARVHAGMSETDAAAMRDQETQAVATANALAALQQQMLFHPADTNPGGDAIFTTADAQEIATQAYKDQSGATMAEYQASLPKRASAAAGGVSKVVSAAAAALKQKLSDWQSIADKYSDISKSIQDSLGPKLVAGVASPLMLAKGTSVLDNLKKQLTDTLHLKKDLAALAKGGLSSGLLEQLTAGGLGSLGAADELLAGGKSGIHAVNKVAGQITSAGGSIAGADAARQFADSLRNKPQKIVLEVGKGGDDVLDKWLSKALKTKGPKYYGLKAA